MDEDFEVLFAAKENDFAVLVALMIGRFQESDPTIHLFGSEGGWRWGLFGEGLLEGSRVVVDDLRELLSKEGLEEKDDAKNLDRLLLNTGGESPERISDV